LRTSTGSPVAGTDGYYTGKESHVDLPTITVNLKGEGASSRSRSPRATDSARNSRTRSRPKRPPEVTAERARLPRPFDPVMPEVKDRLDLLLSNKTAAEIEGLENKKRLKEEIRHELEEAVFPERLGRVEKVFIKEIVVQ
jgi:flagellar basal body-associated protein FliL